MTQDEIIAMAIENTINGLNFNQEGLVRFANLVAAKEREACAKTLESISNAPDMQSYANAIRARGEA
jgi:hypothetical protein